MDHEPAAPAGHQEREQQQELSLRVLLQEMLQRGASDLHITVGNTAMLRLDGDLAKSKTGQVLTPKDTLALSYSILTENQKKRFEVDDELDFSFGVQNLSRFRGNVYKQRGCVAMAIRQIPYDIVTLDQLGMPPILTKLARRPRGLVLVTGPTGAGKTTTLAAMVDMINRERKAHIITIEDPIEFIHRHQKCIINQREVGADTQSFTSALKYALRQDPDIVLIGEMRDLEGPGQGSGRSRRATVLRLRHLAHERQLVLFAVFEERHPQLVISHVVHEVWIDVECDAALDQRLVCAGNVGDFVIQERGAVALRSLAFTNHETDSVQIEERHAGRGLEKEANAEYVAIKCHRSLQLQYRHEDLPQCLNAEALVAHACLRS